MGKICIGSIVKVTIDAEGLTDNYLSDEAVDCTAIFYGSDDLSKNITIPKSKMVNEEEGSSNQLYFAVDTSTLATGVLNGEIVIEYPIEGIDTKLKQRTVIAPLDVDGSKIVLINSVLNTPVE